MFRNLISALVACMIASASMAQQFPAPFNVISFELEYASAAGADERIALLERAVARINAEPEPDIPLFFDLNTLMVDELEQAGRMAEAARLATQLAQFSVRQGASYGIDPITHISRAALLAEAAGEYALALGLYEAEVAYRRDGGQTGSALAQIWDSAASMASRMDRPDETMRLEELAADIRIQAARADTRSIGVARQNDTRSVGDAGGFREVDVYYATDRARSEDTNPSRMYGGERGPLEYGTLTVSIPDTHVPGAIEAPSVWRLEFTENPAKHVILQSVSPLDRSAFFGTMQAEMQGRDLREAFVFIHGFNVRFEAAAKRAAQLAHDMNYRGVPVLYSWPSAGKTVSYVADTAVVRLSGRRLAQFLAELKAESGADVIHIIAHSMGNRALTDALELMAARRVPEERDEPVFGQVFFAAPDVDAGLFTEMTRTIRPLAERLTLYASQEDWALVTSKKLHGNAPRAGQAGETLLREPHFDTIDMSGLGEDMLEHSYFANDSSALVDIMALLWRNTDPDRRCGLSASEAAGNTRAVAWIYEKGTCEVPMIMGLIASAWDGEMLDMSEIRTLIAKYAVDVDSAADIEARFVSILGLN